METKAYLIVNTGSASHKYALYKDGQFVASLHLEKSDGGYIANFGDSTSKGRSNPLVFEMTAAEYGEPFKYCLDKFKAEGFILSEEDIGAICFRIVAPGQYFIDHKEINDEYLSKLLDVKSEAPLHISPVLNEVEEIKKIFSTAKLFGVSDSLAHKNMPEVSSRYAIPEEDYLLGIKRYGYHGISVSSVLYKVEKILGHLPERLIVCHLGSGSSITAVRGGASIDTSMGFTPLEGVPMGSRVGNIDPGALTYLGDKKKLDYAELERYLNEKCGLLGFSGRTKDVRELIKLEAQGDEKAKLALDSFAYNIKKYIGAYTASLGGLDLLIFTATIGERSDIMRERILSNLENLGLVLDKTKNSQTISRDGFINDDTKPIKIAVINTDEMGEMAREMANMLS